MQCKISTHQQVPIGVLDNATQYRETIRHKSFDVAIHQIPVDTNSTILDSWGCGVAGGRSDVRTEIVL
jgi:hypothetical protein